MDIDETLVRRLITLQFPQWAELPIRPVEFDGWDNRTFHLGEEMSVRLPSAACYAAQVEKEQHWLPRLAPFLPLPIPVRLATGVPAAGYPWRWTIYKWLEGKCATLDRIDDLTHFASELARFLNALQQIDVDGGPAPGPHNFFRGGPLTQYDKETRDAIVTLRRRCDTDAAIEVWLAALNAPWQGPPVWIHGDVSATNLLVHSGRLSAVIDFGCLGIGDPACDLTIAWTFLFGESRQAFSTALAADELTWARARGWALWKGLITLVKHIDSNSLAGEEARRVIDEVLADHEAATD